MVGRPKRSAAGGAIELLSSSQSSQSSENETAQSNGYKYVSRKTQPSLSATSTDKQKRVPSSSDNEMQGVSSDNSDFEDTQPKKIEDQKSARATRAARNRRVAVSRGSDHDSDIAIANDSSLIHIDGVDSASDDSASDADEDDDDDDFRIQVPDSSPLKKSKKSALKLKPVSTLGKTVPNLRIFQYNPKNNTSSGRSVSPTISSTGSTSSDYIEMKKAFPDLPSGTIISALKKYKTIAKTYIHLNSISKSMPRKTVSVSRQSGRLDSLSHHSAKIGLSSSPLGSPTSSRSESIARRRQREVVNSEVQRRREARELEMERERERASARRKAEKESIVSSRVQINKKDRGLKDRYLSNSLNRKRKDIIEDDEEEDEEEDGEEEESDGIEVIESDDSLEEIAAPKRRAARGKKRYESDDDDYNPYGKSKRAKSEKRADRAERRAVTADDDDALLFPGFEIDEDADLNISEKIVKLFNNADIRDVIDLTGMKPEEASIVLENRPYRNYSDIKKINVQPTKVSKAKHWKDPMERYLEAASQKLSAYSAIDTLLKQCFEYSKSITKDVRKWGVNLKGKNLDGELAITNVNVSSEEESESDDSDGDSESDDEGFSKKTKEKRIYNRKKFRLDGSEFDDDFSSSSRKKIYKSALDNTKVKDRTGYFKKKPALLSDSITLKDYQQVGINWIHLLFKKQLSCILADEMGLGKTAQVISFLSHLKKKRYPGPHLIVVPSSTLENWLREFEKFSPTLKVIPYYGSMDEREELKSVLYEDDYDVVVTTYNLATGKNDSVFLQSLDFNVVVYDEGHMLKNATSDRYKKLTRLRANFRLLLTGTPLQNNLKELISLLDFILPEIFSPKLSKLEFLFDQRATTKSNETKIEGKTYNPLMSEQAISKAKVMMSPFVLRRTKAQVMKDLPQKHTSIEYCSMVPSQIKIYEEELEEIQALREEKARRKLMSEAEVKKLPVLSKRSTNILMTLRKACMHPLLFRRNYTDRMLRVMAKAITKNPAFAESNEQYVFEDFQIMSDFEITQFCHSYPNEMGKFVLRQKIYEESGKVKALVELVEKIIEKGEKVLIFSMFTQMLDVLEKVLSIHGWKFLRLDGTTMVDTRQTMIDKFYEDKTIPIFLLSTKAGGFGINLVCANNVILYDQSLNPHDDKQAEDRAHRVGQTKEVNVVRLITKNSIEENILHMAFNKLQLDNSMMAQNVEDVLLKTVEDILESKKDEEPENKDDKSIGGENKKAEESSENAFEAFEAPIALEMAESENADEGVEILENKHDSTEEESGKRSKRKRQQVNYSERGIVQLTDDLLIEEDEANKDKKDESFELDGSDEDSKKQRKKHRKSSPKSASSATSATTAEPAEANGALDENIKPADLAPAPLVPLLNNTETAQIPTVSTHSDVPLLSVPVSENDESKPVIPVIEPTPSFAAPTEAPIPLVTESISAGAEPIEAPVSSEPDEPVVVEKKEVELKTQNGVPVNGSGNTVKKEFIIKPVTLNAFGVLMAKKDKPKQENPKEKPLRQLMAESYPVIYRNENVTKPLEVKQEIKGEKESGPASESIKLTTEVNSNKPEQSPSLNVSTETKENAERIIETNADCTTEVSITKNTT